MGNNNDVIILLSVIIIIIINLSTIVIVVILAFLSQSRSQNADRYAWDVLDEDRMINIQLTRGMPRANKAFSLIAHEA